MDSRNETPNQLGFVAKAKDELRAIAEDKRIVTIIKAVVEETVVGKATKPFREGYRALIKIEHEQRRERLAKFIIGIAQDNDEIPDIPQEDFLAVVRKLLQDDEDAKVWFYVRLCVMLARSTLDRDTRLYYLRMASELTNSQILFARELYLRDSIPIKGYLSTEAAQSDLTSANNGMTLRALSTLSNWGLIKSRNGIGDHAVYDLTPDMQQLMVLLFNPDDLTAEKIDKESKDTPDVIIIDYLKSVKDLFVTHLRQTLEKSGLSVEVVERNSNFREMKQAKYYITNNHHENRPSSGPVKHSIAMYVLRHPDNPTAPVKSPDKKFMVSQDSFMGTGSGKYGGADLLIKELDTMAAFVVERLQPKTPD